VSGVPPNEVYTDDPLVNDKICAIYMLIVCLARLQMFIRSDWYVSDLQKSAVRTWEDLCALAAGGA